MRVKGGHVVALQQGMTLGLLSGSFVALLGVQGFSEALEILRPHANDSMARGIYIRDEKKRDGKSDRQN